MSTNIEKSAPIYVAGHGGLVGSAVCRSLVARGYKNIVTKDRRALDLCDQSSVRAFFKQQRPRYVILAAAKVGGIQANNTAKGDFILENLQIQGNVIGEAFKTEEVEKLVFLGSSCIYPKLAPQPMGESSLLTGSLEPTNDAYAIAKIAGLLLCRSLFQQYGRRFISVMPTNVYGPYDNYDLQGSHVLPALIRKFHEAKQSGAPTVLAWGSGSPLREFIHSDDLADAIVFCLENYEDVDHLNIGTGQEVSIRKLTELIAKTVGYLGNVEWDASKPDGSPRKLLDSSKLFSLGWQPKISLPVGLAQTYASFVAGQIKGHR